MRSITLFALLVFTACKGTTDDDTDPPDTDVDTDVDTDPPWGDEDGSLALIRTYVDGELADGRLVAFFATSDQGFVNLASCALSEDNACLRELPSNMGTFLPYDPEDRFAPANSVYRYVGVSIPFGPYEAFYEVTDDWSYYTADITQEAPYEGVAGLELGVEWGPFQTDEAATIPSGLVTTLPLAEQTDLVLSDQVDYSFQWEAGGGGEMYLTVRTLDPLGVNRVYKLDDTGEYLLDITTLGLSGEHELFFTLARWTFDTIDVNGSDLTIQTIAQSEFSAQFVDVLGRAPLEFLRDNCGEALAGITADGQYYGDLAPFADDTQQAACLPSFNAANAQDAIVDIQIPPRSRVDVNYRQLNANASMYVFESCDEPPVCLLGADDSNGVGIETLRMFNPSNGSFLDRVLVLDAADPLSGGLFFVDLETVPVPEPELADTCAQALGAAPLLPGVYYSDATQGLLDAIDPGFTGCTSSSLPGPDGMLPIEIPDTATLEVTVSMEGGADPALYLLQNCQDTSSCILGSDQIGAIETLIYTNNTGATQTPYLVLDTDGELFPYTLTIGLN